MCTCVCVDCRKLKHGRRYCDCKEHRHGRTIEHHTGQIFLVCLRHLFSLIIWPTVLAMIIITKHSERVTHSIRKTCPCNVYPLIPHFHIGKLGFAGVCLFFLFLLQNIHCGYSLEPPRRGGSNVYPQCMF